MFVQAVDTVVVNKMISIEIVEYDLLGKLIGVYVVEDPEVNLFTLRVRFVGDYFSPAYDELWKKFVQKVPEGFQYLTSRKEFAEEAVIEFRYYCRVGKYKYAPKEMSGA